MVDGEPTLVGQATAAMRHAAAIVGRVRGELDAFDRHVADTRSRMAALGFLGIARNLQSLADDTRSLHRRLHDIARTLDDLCTTLAALTDNSAPREVTTALTPAVRVIEDAGAAKHEVGTDLVRLRQQVAAKLHGGSPQLLLHRVEVMRQACMQAFGLLDTAKKAADKALRTATTAGTADGPSPIIGRLPPPADSSLPVEPNTAAPRGTTPPTPRASDSPRTPTGGRGQQFHVAIPQGATSKNQAEVIDGRPYSGHALDRMQRQGVMPSMVDNVVRSGESMAGKVPGTTVFYDRVNNMTVVADTATGRIVTVDYGRIRQ